MVDVRAREPKLPVKQLAILAVVRFAEPLALTSVFPYLPEMIESFGVEKDQVAKWAGITSAVFSVSQSATAIAWGSASDQIGRKPTVLIGLITTMICFIAWGMSTSLLMAITVRAIQGSGNGNVGIIRTMVAEMVPEKVLQPRAFSIMPLVWSIGSVFGPSFGGFFARPAEQFPSLFGNVKFLKDYPFLLPNIVAGVFFFISVVTATLFLNETLESKRHEEDWGLRLGEKLTRSFRRRPRPRAPRRSFVDAEATTPLLAHSAKRSPAPSESSAALAPEPDKSDIFTYDTVMALVCYTFLALHSVAYDQVLPVFLNYPRHSPDGAITQLPFKFACGFGLSSSKIGTIFTIYGITCGLIQFLVFPPLCAHFGVVRCYRFAAVVFPVVYLLTPYTALVQNQVWRYAFLLAVLLVKGCLVIFGFPCITIMLTNSASSLRILGTLNGYATTFSGIGRAIGPAMTGATITWGIQRGYMIAGWWLLAVIAIIGAVPPWFIEERDGPARPGTAEGDEPYEQQALLGDDESEGGGGDATAAGDGADLAKVRKGSGQDEEPDDATSESSPSSGWEVRRRSYGTTKTARNSRMQQLSMSPSGEHLGCGWQEGGWRPKQESSDAEE